ncbi:cilia- and flagella-associated protein 73 isoform X1 [Hyla sarda]|uniref:cilia- and flagella-associated protein 73 isoform X1 n=2 Tax=Hyla sarda TaxID=327740 RepID=UPI0024C3CAE4|nr:cilia- and flagella-associated protein 73 isoform X1 [Hyla sarda]
MGQCFPTRGILGVVVLQQREAPWRMPDREDDFLTPATRLLEKKREMIEVEQALNTQKEEFQMKTESLQQRRAELEHKEEKLKDSLFKFDKFLKENDSKRKRALRKAGEERQLAAQKEREAIRLQAENIQLQTRKEKLLHRQGKNSIYQQYLQRVLERTEEFQEVQEMIDRFNTLMATQEKLLKRELEYQEKTERERARLLHYQEEAHSQILELNNQIADLQGQLERARAVVLEWESGWAQIQNTAAENTLRLGRIRMAALNLFQTITKQMHMKSDISIEDTEMQLEKIKMCFMDLDAIYKDLKKSDLTPLTTAMSSTN